MRHLNRVSYLITLAGIVAVAAALALGLDQTVVLVGLMLVIAGLVKIAMVAIWRGVAGFGVPLADGEAAPSTTTREEVQR